jgi:hypothetical protein
VHTCLLVLSHTCFRVAIVLALPYWNASAYTACLTCVHSVERIASACVDCNGSYIYLTLIHCLLYISHQQVVSTIITTVVIPVTTTVQYVSPFIIGTSCDTRFINAQDGLVILHHLQQWQHRYCHYYPLLRLLIPQQYQQTPYCMIVVQHISTISTYTLPLPINAADLSRMGASATRFCTTTVTTASLVLGYSGDTSSEYHPW